MSYNKVYLHKITFLFWNLVFILLLLASPSFSSDFARARETAQVIHQHMLLSFPIVFDLRLRERFFGDFNGLGIFVFVLRYAIDTKSQIIWYFQTFRFLYFRQFILKYHFISSILYISLHNQVIQITKMCGRVTRHLVQHIVNFRVKGIICDEFK